MLTPNTSSPKTLDDYRAHAVLSKVVRDSSTGLILTRYRWVEMKLREGATLSTTEENVLKPMSRLQHFRADNAQQREHERRVKVAGKKTVYWIGDYEVTKTEYNYATLLLESQQK